MSNLRCQEFSLLENFVKKVKNLMFVHHCRDIIANINQARLEAQKFSNCNVVFCEDKAVFEL